MRSPPTSPSELAASASKALYEDSPSSVSQQKQKEKTRRANLALDLGKTDRHTRIAMEGMLSFEGLPDEVMQSMITPMHQILPPPGSARTSPTSPRRSLSTFKSTPNFSKSPSPPSLVRGTLYLGSLSALTDEATLQSANVTHLLSVLDQPWLPALSSAESARLKKYRVEVPDVPGVNADGLEIEREFQGACEWIEEALSSGGNVLVHCQQGVSRSPTIVLAYMIQRGYTYPDALALVKRARPCVKPNRGFIQALQRWEERCQKAKGVPGSPLSPDTPKPRTDAAFHPRVSPTSVQLPPTLTTTHVASPTANALILPPTTPPHAPLKETAMHHSPQRTPSKKGLDTTNRRKGPTSLPR